MALKPWKTLSARCVVHDRWMKLRADRCETSSGVILDPYYVQEPEDWVQVVAFDARERVLITRQYRHGIGLVCMELPCGVVEEGEAAAAAARRELLEETGCTAQTMEPLAVLSPNPARYTNKVHTFVATGVEHARCQELDETEEIEFEFIPVADILTSIDRRLFPQALHVASLLLALYHRGFCHLK